MMLPIFDGHNDTLLDLHFPARGKGRSFFTRSEIGHIDLPRAREGGFGGGLFAIFVPSPSEAGDPRKNLIATATGYEVRMSPAVAHSYAQEVAIAMMALLFRLEAESAGQLQVVRTADELAPCLLDGVLAAVLHFEGAEAIDSDLDALEVFYRAGLRSLGIVWSRPNAFAYGVPFKFPHSPDTGPGLTDAGRELVRACNRMGILLDLSHLNEQGFWDVAALTEKPLVATHSNAHAISPSTRNLTDKQLDAIRESEGMVGLNFSVHDLRNDGSDDQDTPITLMVLHMDYLIEHLGVDCVGLGSDFDGTTISNEIGDVTGVPRFIAALREHGYDEATLRKITHGNWLRVLRKTWR
jgi:membrane dipeptidase